MRGHLVDHDSIERPGQDGGLRHDGGANRAAVIDSVLLDVAYGDNLDLWSREYPADLADGLGAESNASQGNLLAGRDEAGSAQHMTRYDGKSRGRCGASCHELASRESGRVR